MAITSWRGAFVLFLLHYMFSEECRLGMSFAMTSSNSQRANSRRNKSSTAPLSVSSTSPPKAKPDQMGGIGPEGAQSDTKSSKPAPYVPKAPLVDSTLLRFLSTQKKVGAPTLPRDGATQQMDPTTDSVTDDSYEKTVNMVNETGDGDILDNTTAQSSENNNNIEIITKNSLAASPSWLAQFNANRIAQQLIAQGVDEVTASEAGRVVQNHVLARTTRRRIRKFLQDRDRQWASGITERQQVDIDFFMGAAKDADGSMIDVNRYSVEEVISVLIGFGLTGRDIASIFTHTPSVAMMKARKLGRPEVHKIESNTTSNNSTLSYEGTGVKESFARIGWGVTLEETLESAFAGLLCGTLKLRKYDARKVLRNCPGLLTRRGSESAEQVVTLLSSLGVSPLSLKRDKAALPTLLSRSPASLFRLVAFLSSDKLRIPVSKIGAFIRKRECAELLDAVAPIPAYCLSLNEKSEDESFPSVTDFWGESADVRRNKINRTYLKMTHTAQLLRRDVGVKDLGRVLLAYPSVLLLDASTQIKPVTDFLCEDIGIWEGDVPKVLQTYPELLGKSVPQMLTVVEYLISLEVAEEDLEIIFRSFPSLLSLDVETRMVPVVKFLQEIGIGNIGRFITRLPPVLGYSVERELQPKWDFLQKVCDFNTFEVVRFPAYFSYPFERVIKARYEYLRDVKRLPLQLFGVDDVLRSGDSDFAMRVAGDYDKGEAFSKFLNERKERIQAGGERKLKKQTSSARTQSGPRYFGNEHR